MFILGEVHNVLYYCMTGSAIIILLWGFKINTQLQDGSAGPIKGRDSTEPDCIKYYSSLDNKY